jgi:spermidine/putrescine-binding protein
MSRREWLRRSGMTVVTLGASPALFAACGGSSSSSSSASSTAAAAGSSTAAGPTPGIQGNGTVGGTIDFLSWEGYDLPDPMKDWKTTNHVDLKPTYIATHDDIQAKLIAADGKGGYDLITYYQGYKPLYRELKLLSPLDPEQVPNMKNLYPYFQGDQGNFWVEPDGTRTGVPWDYGAIGITWDDAVLPGGVKSWHDLLDPKFKGKVGAVDDPQGNLALVCHILGKKPDQIPKNSQDLQDIKDYLTTMWAQTTGVSASYGDMTQKLVSGDVVVCWMGWAAMNTFAAGKGTMTVKTILPTEGSYGFSDAWAIPPGADNVSTIYSWMNQTLDPTTNARIAEYLVGATVCPAGVDQLKPDIKALYDYSNIDALFAAAPLYNNPPTESTTMVTTKEWTDAYTEIKAGVGG